MSQEIPPVAVLVAHRIADWDQWKQVFDDHAPARKEASYLGHDVHRDADDPDMVYIYCAATDTDRLKAFLESADLRDTMNNAGVVGAPTVTLMTPKSADFIADQMLAGLVVIHDVEDYDRWRKAYDDFDDHRKESGIVGHAVSQELGNPNRVIVYHQANDVDTLRQFAHSPRLKDAMQRAGVVGAPEIHIGQMVDLAEY